MSATRCTDIPEETWSRAERAVSDWPTFTPEQAAAIRLLLGNGSPAARAATTGPLVDAC